MKELIFSIFLIKEEMFKRFSEKTRKILENFHSFNRISRRDRNANNSNPKPAREHARSGGARELPDVYRTQIRSHERQRRRLL